MLQKQSYRDFKQNFFNFSYESKGKQMAAIQETKPQVPVGYNPVENSQSSKISSKSSHDPEENFVQKLGGLTIVDGLDPRLKRVRALRKKLQEIDSLKEKIDIGELKNPEKNQLEKISKRDDLQRELDLLEEQLHQTH